MHTTSDKNVGEWF